MHKKILIIKTGSTLSSLLAKGEDFEDWFMSGSGSNVDEFHCCALYLGEELPELAAIKGIIITGSPVYLTDLEPWNYIAAQYIRKAHEQKIPILGICYGHQLIAWAFGGEVGFHPQGREIGTVKIELTDEAQQDALLSGTPRQFAAQVSHQQSVLTLPENSTLLAANSFEPNHGFRLGETTWGFQFHPEFSAEVVAEYIRSRAAEIKAEGQDVSRLLQQVHEAPESAALLRRFVQIVSA